MPFPEWTPPREFDEYRLLKRLGHGAMGQVWLGRDTFLERAVAIKFIGFAVDSAEVRDRFLTEARAAARVQHPNVVAVHRVGMALGHPYTVTELLEGKALDALELPLPSDRVLDLGLQLARGLAAAHRRGVLHRDLKPANVFLTDTGEVKILDFGLAKLSPVPADSDASENVDAPFHHGRSSDGDTSEVRRAALDGQSAPMALAATASSPARPPARTLPRLHPNAPAAPNLVATFVSETRPSAPSRSVAPRSMSIFASESVMGTPLYMAPECWMGSPATSATDVYALGGLLYELLAGKPPPAYLPPGPIGVVVRAHGIRPLADVAPQVNADLARVVERCLALDPSSRYASGDAVREALEALLTSPALVRRRIEGNPYRGLLCFEAEHRAVFFGRQAEARAVLERLKSDGCVVVIADSGAGKSSLCRAAVLPACAEGALGEGRSWSCTTLVPGRRPLSALASALAAVLGSDELALERAISGDPESIPSIVRRGLGAARGLVLFVDQLEELATIGTTVAERDAFVRALLALCARGPGLRVLASMRSDLLGRVAALSPELPAVLSRNLLLLGPPSPEGLSDMITGPARLNGFSFESDDTVKALAAFGGRPGALPLLQFALTELWEARDEERHLLPRAALDGLGGAEGALARHADQTLARLSREEAAAAREVLLLLVSADDTRRRTPHEELVRGNPHRQAALDTLSHDRLVVARGGPGGDGYELAHEALVTGWPRLRDWLDDDAGTRALRERLERAATEWDRLQPKRGPQEGLWGPAQLAELERLSEWPLAESVKRFVQASRREQRRRRWRIPAVGASLLAAAIVAWGGTALHQQRQLSAQIAGRLRQGDEAASEAHALETEWRNARADAYRTFDQGNWKQGEDLWAHARTKEAAVESAASRATTAYESAVLLDASRSDTRARLADWLIERALSADDANDAQRRDELIARAALFDDSGTRAARLGEPAHVTLSVAPEGTHVRISRYHLEGFRYVLGDARDFVEGAFEPGSYLLELTAPDYAPVRLPILLARSESRSFTVRLLPAAKVPEGFVHIPVGRFLFGAAGDDEVRRTDFEAAPMHSVELGEYLIARHELTYGEYITFLRALPPSERHERLPHSTSPRAADQEVALTEQQGRFELVVRVAGPRYRAREGDALVYSARAARSAQDWSKLPVTGITPKDVEAYADWLDRSGKVPGARVCPELEWERAARGADSRMYPHAERLAPEDANYDETHGNTEGVFGPDEVGTYTGSDSPFGVSDLTGNAWEVVRAVRGGDGVVVRGGSFYVGQLAVRAVNQWVITHTFRSVENGARLCADVKR